MVGRLIGWWLAVTVYFTAYLTSALVLVRLNFNGAQKLDEHEILSQYVYEHGHGQWRGWEDKSALH